MHAARWAVLLSVTLFLYPANSNATSIVIQSDGGGDQPNIQAGIAAAAAGDTVLLQPGTYTGTGNRGVVVNNTVVITSSGGAEVTIVDCQQADNGFEVRPGASEGTVISRLTIQNALVAVDVLFDGVSVLIEDNVLQDGSDSGVSVISAAATIRNNIIQRNFASTGGGIYAGAASVTIENNIIRDNVANTRGGGIHCGGFGLNSSLTIRNNEIYRNEAMFDRGGGISFVSVNPPLGHDVSNNTLSENTAANAGGGYYFDNSAVMVNNDIIAFSPHGGGIFAFQSEMTSLSCCDVFGNVSANGDNLTGVIDAGFNISLDPAFCGPLGSEKYFIQSTSPCAPDNSPCLSLIGARPVACETSSVPDPEIRSITWGDLKSLYGND